MSTKKVDLTLYGEDADKIIMVIPDLLRIARANGINCEVGKLKVRVDE